MFAERDPAPARRHGAARSGNLGGHEPAAETGRTVMNIRPIGRHAGRSADTAPPDQAVLGPGGSVGTAGCLRCTAMSAVWAAEGFVAGVPAGAVLRSAVFRLSVPSDAPDRTSCPRCAAPAPRWVLIRCGHCGQHFGTLGALELVTALVLGLLFGRFGGQPDMLAFCFLGALTFAALTGHAAGALGRALLGGLVLGGTYLVLALLRPGGIGGGDVKLAGLAGLALGWLGWPT